MGIRLSHCDSSFQWNQRCRCDTRCLRVCVCVWWLFTWIFYLL